jgi:hypothetical protein
MIEDSQKIIEDLSGILSKHKEGPNVTKYLQERQIGGLKKDTSTFQSERFIQNKFFNDKEFAIQVIESFQNTIANLGAYLVSNNTRIFEIFKNTRLITESFQANALEITQDILTVIKQADYSDASVIHQIEDNLINLDALVKKQIINVLLSKSFIEHKILPCEESAALATLLIGVCREYNKIQTVEEQGYTDQEMIRLSNTVNNLLAMADQNDFDILIEGKEISESHYYEHFFSQKEISKSQDLCEFCMNVSFILQLGYAIQIINMMFKNDIEKTSKIILHPLFKTGNLNHKWFNSLDQLTKNLNSIIANSQKFLTPEGQAILEHTINKLIPKYHNFMKTYFTTATL